MANKNAGPFVDIHTNTGMIAIAQLSSGTPSSSYSEYKIPFEYLSTTRTPKYILIVGAASKFGNYFTGSTNSIIYLDQFSLGYA